MDCFSLGGFVNCITCDNTTFVIDSKKLYDPDEIMHYVERRRECPYCQVRFNSIEITIEKYGQLFNQGEKS